jgi:hypothetical protein
MGALGMTVRTAVTGQLVKIAFNASLGGRQRADLQMASGKRVVDHSTGPFQLENLVITVREKKMGETGQWGTGHGIALTVSTGRWHVQAWSKPYPNMAANPGKALINLQIESTYDADHDVVAPHGLIGQSYDGDGIAVDGAEDDYQPDEVTTSAMAEGAIEGKASDYKMSGAFATDYMFSRFDLTEAKPRDVSKLTGRKRAVAWRNGARAVGAQPDVE